MLTIENGNYVVKINEHGATLDSIKYKNEEFLWQGNKNSWEGKDVAIFPFVARLKDGYYTYNGEKYELKTHGIIRYTDLKIEKLEKDFLHLSLLYNEETLKVYPFKFKFNAKFKISDEKLSVEYVVENLDTKEIYFGLGGHPALYIPAIINENYSDISGNYLSFNKTYDLKTYTLDEKGCFITGKEEFEKTDKIQLTKKLFEKYKTLMLTAKSLNEVTLVRKDNKCVQFKYEGADILALWTCPTFGEYICLEPWTSTPDALSPQREIEQKSTIKTLNVNDKYSLKYEIKIL